PRFAELLSVGVRVWGAPGRAEVDPRCGPHLATLKGSPDTANSDLKIRPLGRAGRAAFADLQLRRAAADRAAGRDAGGEERRAADGAALAQQRVAAEDDGVGVDGHVVADGRVALVALDHAAALVLKKRQGPERHALVDLDVVADLGRLTDHHARAVV